MGPGKLGGAPASDGVPHVLAGADHHGEDNEDTGGVEMVKSVNQVVIVPNFHVGYPSNRPNNAVHPEKTRNGGFIVSFKTIFCYFVLLSERN